jgi:hypothetical protein
VDKLWHHSLRNLKGERKQKLGHQAQRLGMGETHPEGLVFSTRYACTFANGELYAFQHPMVQDLYRSAFVVGLVAGGLKADSQLLSQVGSLRIKEKVCAS